MYRCPRCNVELSLDARFCPRCGFNQTNARMQKVASQQAAQQQRSGQRQLPVTPATIDKSKLRQRNFPPSPLTPPAPSLRSSQPEVQTRHSPTAPLNEQASHPFRQYVR